MKRDTINDASEDSSYPVEKLPVSQDWDFLTTGEVNNSCQVIITLLYIICTCRYTYLHTPYTCSFTFVVEISVFGTSDSTHGLFIRMSRGDRHT